MRIILDKVIICPEAKNTLKLKYKLLKYTIVPNSKIIFSNSRMRLFPLLVLS